MEQRFLVELEGKLAGRIFSSENGGLVVAGDVSETARTKQPQFEVSPLTIKFGTGMSRAFYEWIGNSVNGNGNLRQSGSVISLDHGSTPTSRRDFLDAVITRVEFPDLDSSSKNDAMITAVIQPERVKVGPESKMNMGVYKSAQANTWSVNNFRLRIDGLHSDCAQVKRIKGLRVQRGIKKLYTGQEHFPSVEPTKLEFAGITVEVPNGFGKEFVQWDSVTRGGKMSYGSNKNGSIEFIAPGSRRAYFVVNFTGLMIVSIAKAANSMNVALVFESMSFKPGGAAIK